MELFVHATEYGAHMYAKFEDLILFGFLQINASSLAFLEFHARQYCTKQEFGQVYCQDLLTRILTKFILHFSEV
jgi:hypothetical protein